MRLIDANAFACFIVDHLPRTAPQEAYDAYFNVIRMLKDEKATPTADVVVPKKGKWIKEPNCWYRCSHCGSHYPSIKDTMEYNYCPDCGSDMREEKTDGK